jgi:release factor glutamine methyltransferase
LLIAQTVRLVQSLAPKRVRVNGILYEVTPSVFNPKFFVTSKLLAENMHVADTDTVLDMGSGSGIQAITAAARARCVVATDISLEATCCTRKNASRAGVANKVMVFCGDLFSALPSPMKFDVILFNPPYLEGTPRSTIERCLFDPHKSILTRFFAEAGTHLRRGGSIQMCYSTAACLRCLTRIAEENGWHWEIIARCSIGIESFLLYKFRRT